MVREVIGLLQRNKIIGSKATTLAIFDTNYNEKTKELSISGGEFWQNNKILFEDLEVVDEEGSVIQESGTTIILEDGKEYRIFLNANGIEVCSGLTLNDIADGTDPLMLLAYGNTNDLTINEVAE